MACEMNILRRREEEMAVMLVRWRFGSGRADMH
jgi:hypothetical protein